MKYTVNQSSCVHVFRSSEHASCQAQALYRAQSGRGTSNYPWAVVANNLTLMLADVLELRADRFVASRKGYWGVFDRRAAYFEVTHFCVSVPLRVLLQATVGRGRTPWWYLRTAVLQQGMASVAVGTL